MTHKLVSILLLAFALCACKDKTVTAGPPIERFKLDGVVLSLDASGHIAKIKGEKIEGWMEAMTMEYPVKDRAEFDALHVGDHITATVFVQGLNYSLGEIHHVR
jgi:Cu/Ag efflux protein CusF